MNLNHSVFGLSSYFLWTQKGVTTLPLVRGSGFLLPFRDVNGFHKFHVVTAAHVSCPVRYPQLFTSEKELSPLKAIGQRHISNKLLVPRGEKKGQLESYPLRFPQHFMPVVDVSILRLEDESSIDGVAKPLEVDPDPLQQGEEIVLCGADAVEEPANPNDDGLTLVPCQLEAVCKAGLVSINYGTVLLGAVKSFEEQSVIPLSMCGGPVLRRSTGKVVGVTVARVTRYPPLRDPSKPGRQCDPSLDVSEHKDIMQQWPIHFAFVPALEFIGTMRRSEF